VLRAEPLRLGYYGPVQPATPREIEQLAAGDKPIGVMKFFCKMPRQIYLTRDLAAAVSADDGAASDVIEFRGGTYAVMQVAPWQHFKWVRAFAALKEGILWHPYT
jgi:hypothetical protein